MIGTLLFVVGGGAAGFYGGKAYKNDSTYKYGGAVAGVLAGLLLSRLVL